MLDVGWDCGERNRETLVDVTLRGFLIPGADVAKWVRGYFIKSIISFGVMTIAVSD